MRTRISAVITFIVVTAFVAIGAATGASAAPTFRIEPGQYPWHMWNSPAYRQAFPDQHEFFCKTADLSGLPFKGDDCEEAFRHLAAGTMITFPELPGQNNALEQENKELRELNAGLQRQLGELHKTVAAPTPTNVTENSNANQSFFYEKFGDWGILVWGLVAIGFILAGYFWNEARIDGKKLVYTEKERQAQYAENAKVNRELTRQKFFIDKHLTKVEVPEDIGGRGFGNELAVTYLPKANPVDGDDAVLFPGKDSPVKVKNIKKHLNEASPEQLKEMGIFPQTRKAKKEPELPLKPGPEPEKPKDPTFRQESIKPDPHRIWDPTVPSKLLAN